MGWFLVAPRELAQSHNSIRDVAVAYLWSSKASLSMLVLLKFLPNL